jgi:hypothetical protein
MVIEDKIGVVSVTPLNIQENANNLLITHVDHARLVLWRKNSIYHWELANLGSNRMIIPDLFCAIIALVLVVIIIVVVIAVVVYYI